MPFSPRFIVPLLLYSSESLTTCCGSGVTLHILQLTWQNKTGEWTDEQRGWEGRRLGQSGQGVTAEWKLTGEEAPAGGEVSPGADRTRVQGPRRGNGLGECGGQKEGQCGGDGVRG